MKSHLFLTSIFAVAMIAIASGAGLEPQSKNISIGALVDITGDWSSQGMNSKAALEASANDVNSYLEKIGSANRINLIIRDSGGDPATAQRELENLSQDGIKVVIAVTTSAELGAMKDYADENGIMIIGTASTAPSLSIPGDNLIRLAPDDTNQGYAMAQVFKHMNISVIVPIARGDVWGDDLLDAATKSFEADGGKLLEGVRYSPGTNFSTEVKSLSSRVKEAKSRYGSDNVGVYMLSIDEAASLLQLASKDQELSSVRWFGSDGVAGLETISENSTLAGFAARTGLISPYLVVGENNQGAQYKKVEDSIVQETGSKPNFYAMVSYDALWACAESMIEAGSADPGQIREALFHTVNRYKGITTDLSLNDAGDRERAIYDLIAVKEDSGNGSYSWQSIGQFARWGPGTDVLTWK